MCTIPILAYIYECRKENCAVEYKKKLPSTRKVVKKKVRKNITHTQLAFILPSTCIGNKNAFAVIYYLQYKSL